MLGIWEIFFPTQVEVPEVEIQPSYKHMRLRGEVLRGIRNNKLKLRRTFIVESYNQTTYRLPDVSGSLRRRDSDPTPLGVWYIGH